MKNIKVVFPHLNDKENENVFTLTDLYTRYCVIIEKKVKFNQKNRSFLILAGHFHALKLDYMADDCLSKIDDFYFKKDLFFDIRESQSHLEKSIKALATKDLVTARYHSDQYDFFINMLYVIPWLQKHKGINRKNEFQEFEQILLGHDLFKKHMLYRMYN